MSRLCTVDRRVHRGAWLWLLVGTACQHASAAQPSPRPPAASTAEPVPGAGSRDNGGRFISSEAYYHYLQGQLAEQAGACEPAIASYQRAASYDPDSAYLHVLQGRCLLRLGRLDDSLHEARRALELAPHDVDATQLLARGLMLARDLPQATELLDRALAHHPRAASLVELRAELALLQGDEEQALTLMRRLAEVASADPRPTLALGQLLLRRARWEPAARAFEETLARDPDTVDALQGLARALEAMERPAEACAPAARWVELAPDDAEAVTTLLRLHARAGLRDAARAVIARLRQSGAAPELRVAAAQGLADGGDEAQATAVLEAVLADEPDLDLALVSAGSLHARAGRLQRAERLLARVDPASALYATSQVERARALWRLGEHARARQTLEAALATQPGAVEVAVALADTLARLGQVAQALALLERTPDPPRGRELLVAAHAQALAELGRHDESVREVAALVAARADDPNLLVLLAITYQRVGRHAEGEGAARQALAAAPDHVPAQNFVAYTLAQRGERLDEALELARRAAGAAPDDGYVVDTLGLVLHRRGELDEARRCLERASALSPDEPEILLHLGDVERDLGQPGRARQRYRRALQLRPREPELRRALDSRLAGAEGA